MALTRRVLCPHFKEELRENIQNTPFSLLVDESTDVSCIELIAISIRYYSKEMEKIVSTYLGLEEIVRPDAFSLEACVRRIMENWNLLGKGMVDLGTDSASNWGSSISPVLPLPHLASCCS